MTVLIIAIIGNASGRLHKLYYTLANSLYILDKDFGYRYNHKRESTSGSSSISAYLTGSNVVGYLNGKYNYTGLSFCILKKNMLLSISYIQSAL